MDDRGRLHIAQYWPSWNPRTGLPEQMAGERIPLGFRSDRTGDELSVPFRGSRIALEGRADPWGSYARVSRSTELRAMEGG